MAKVLVHIPIQDGWHGESWLLETVFEMDFLPDEGDLFHPLKNDPESGLTMAVYRRWWQEDGSASLQTHTYIVDPPVDLRPPENKVYLQWNSGTDGDLVGILLANGWWAYGKPKPTQEEIDGRLGEAFKLVLERLEQGILSANEIKRYLFGEDNG